MFNKLKSFSEDVAKSLNEIQQGDTPRKSLDQLKQLKNGSNLLNTKTPDSNDLQQPQDETESSNTSESQLNKESSPSEDRPKSATPSVASSGPLKDIDMGQLPPLVQAKLRKFVKYEEKYPVLLDAYKTEKRKGELVIIFEKILKENTPVSSIADAGELLEYLKSLTEKTSMTEQELRKKINEATSMSKKLNDAEKTLKYSEESLEKAHKENGSLAREIQALKKQIGDLSVQKEGGDEQSDANGDIQKSIDALKEQLGSTQAELEDATVEREKLKEQLQSEEKKKEELQKEIAKLNSDKEAIEDGVLKLKLQLTAIQRQLEETREERDEAKKKIVAQESTERETTPRPDQTVSKSKNKKNKNKKKAANLQQNTRTDEDTHKIGDESVEWKGKYDELSQKHDALANEKEELSKKISQYLETIKNKDEEIDDLRDLLRDIGNDLVAAKDELKKLELNPETEIKLKKLADLEKLAQDRKEQLDKIKEESSEQLEKLRIEIDKIKASSTKELEKHKQESLEKHKKVTEESEKLVRTVKDLRSQLSETKKQLEESTKEIQNLQSEKDKLNERINELSKSNSVDASLKLEIASLESSVSHKDELIKELKGEIVTRAKEQDDLKATIAQLENTNSNLQNSNQNLLQEKSRLVTDKENTAERINSLNKELSKLQTNRHEIASELEALKSKYDALVKSRSNASDEIQSYKQQYEELSMKLKEAHTKIESLEDELTEARQMLLERAREFSTIRKLLLDAEERNNIESARLKSEIRSISEQKLELESSLQATIKLRQREIEELKQNSADASKKIKQLTEEMEALRKKYEPLLKENVISPEANKKIKDLESTTEELRASLQASNTKVKEYENMNRILKKLNEEASMKFDRLLKNFKHVTQQYRQMQSVKSTPPESARSSSEQPPASPSSDKDTNTAYLKNVLIGFFEHKEQREQLMPVVKTLFHLDDSEESKLMNALK